MNAPKEISVHGADVRGMVNTNTNETKLVIRATEGLMNVESVLSQLDGVKLTIAVGAVQEMKSATLRYPPAEERNQSPVYHLWAEFEDGTRLRVGVVQDPRGMAF